MHNKRSWNSTYNKGNSFMNFEIICFYCNTSKEIKSKLKQVTTVMC